MGLKPGTPIADIKIDTVFLGSCTNGRIEDLRAAAAIVKGHHVATKIRAMVVPGSQAVKRQAESEGLDTIFKTAGFEWREPGCSMCLAMNPDILQPGERCASTSNRNFEGRQGRGGRTHLVSPQMAAAAAITGHFTDIRTWNQNGGIPNDPHQRPHLHRRPSAVAQHRHGPDHPQAVPQAHRAHRLRRLPLLRLAPHPGRPRSRPARPQVRPQQPATRAQDPHRRKELRLRQLPRARRLGSRPYGFLAVIAPSFADIFFSNAGKNGMVLVTPPRRRRADTPRPFHREPRAQDHHQPRSPDRHRRSRLQRPLRHRPLPQILPAERPRRHRPDPPPRSRPRRIRNQPRHRTLAKTKVGSRHRIIIVIFAQA